MQRSEKELELERLKTRFGESTTAILIEYRGLKVSEMTGLRHKFVGSDVELKVVKNRLAKLAIAGTDMDGLSAELVGPVAVATAINDSVAMAKILRDFAKDNAKCVIKRGYLRPGRLLAAKDVDILASVPSKEESIAKLMGSMQAPIRNFVCVLAAIPRQLVTVLSAIQKQKEAA